MKRIRITTIGVIAIAATAAAACGSSNSKSNPNEFQNKTLFETYIAGSLDVDHVSCIKTSKTSARCKTPDGSTVIVLCETADASGGHNCTIASKDG